MFLGWIGWLITGVVGLVVLLASVGGILYMTDTAVGATVIDKQCDPLTVTDSGGAESQVTVLTKFPIPGIEHTLKDFDDVTCAGIRAGDNGNFAEYFLKSGRTIVYEREGGACVYDTNGVVC